MYTRRYPLILLGLPVPPYLGFGYFFGFFFYGTTTSFCLLGSALISYCERAGTFGDLGLGLGFWVLDGFLGGGRWCGGFGELRCKGFFELEFLFGGFFGGCGD